MMARAGQGLKGPLPTQVRVRAPGHRAAITTVEGALGFIDRHLPEELARPPRWTFARALFLEAQRTGKSRDLTAAVRQFRQTLSNERWLEETDGQDAKAGKT
jgi:hypothetical protein